MNQVLSESASIVLVGTFNPRIFHPEWFRANGLLRESDVQQALEGKTIITPDVATFKAGWLRLEVLRDRFLVETTDVSCYDPLRDLVASAFGILEHAPLDRMGLNRQMHCKLMDKESWHKLGDKLAPKDLWSTVFRGSSLEGTRPDVPGLALLRIQGGRENSPAERLDVTIGPSRRTPYGIYIHTNEHYDLGRSLAQPEASQQLLEHLVAQWTAAMDFSAKAMRAVASAAT